MDFCFLPKTWAISTAKKSPSKTAEATGNLTGNKIADKITNASKKYFEELHLEKEEANNKKPKERYISSEINTTETDAEDIDIDYSNTNV